MQTALHQDSRSPQIDRLLDLVEDYLFRQDVALSVPRRPVKRAEAAVLRAEVRVVDIAIDDVGDDALRVPFAADGVGLHTDPDEIVGAEQIQRFVAGDHKPLEYREKKDCAVGT